MENDTDRGQIPSSDWELFPQEVQFKDLKNTISKPNSMNCKGFGIPENEDSYLLK